MLIASYNVQILLFGERKRGGRKEFVRLGNHPNILFSRIGEGTLAPWDPTRKLVVVSIYRHVRNPMHLGIYFALLGESILFGSVYVFIWFVSSSIFNHVNIVKKEEPGLARRFGEEYLLYKKNVPRWIPRLRPWLDSGSGAGKRIKKDEE